MVKNHNIDVFARLANKMKDQRPVADHTTVKVAIDPSFMVGPYGKAYYSYLFRINPTRMKLSHRTAQDFSNYFKTLVSLRIRYIHNEDPLSRSQQYYAAPSLMVRVLDDIGIVEDREYGLTLIPTETQTLEHHNLNDAFMKSMSMLLQDYKLDGVNTRRDVFPHSNYGNKEVMSMAVCHNHMVKSYRTDNNPLSAWLAAFVGIHLVKSVELSGLYRLSYDDADAIKSRIFYDRKFFE